MLPSLPELRSRAATSISCICIIYCALAASLSMAPVMHRNAARARVKDAEGKVQRSHFGKKRFEVLRAGLSKGGVGRTNAVRELRPGPPEISLAHAKRARVESSERPKHPLEQDNSWLGLRSPLTSLLRCQLPPPTSTFSGSKVLAALDADDRTCPSTKSPY